MAKHTPQAGTQSATRHYVRVVAFVVFGISLGALLMLHAYPYLEIDTIVVENQASDDKAVDDAVVEERLYELTREIPVRIRIPKLSIDTTFEEPLGLNPDRTIEVPESYDAVGWYEYGAAPGEVGTASILGHVDSYQGAAVFYALGQLAPGDEVLIDRKDGTTATFVVEYLERYKQSEFPTEKVYGMTDYPSLRLITCSGIYERGIARYTHNLVVYGRLVEPM